MLVNDFRNIRFDFGVLKCPHRNIDTDSIEKITFMTDIFFSEVKKGSMPHFSTVLYSYK